MSVCSFVHMRLRIILYITHKIFPYTNLSLPILKNNYNNNYYYYITFNLGHNIFSLALQPHSGPGSPRFQGFNITLKTSHTR